MPPCLRARFSKPRHLEKLFIVRLIHGSRKCASLDSTDPKGVQQSVLSNPRLLVKACAFRSTCFKGELAGSNSFNTACASQRVHVGIWYILRPQRGSHIPTLRPKYITYTYMDPLGMEAPKASTRTSTGFKLRLYLDSQRVHVGIWYILGP